MSKTINNISKNESLNPDFQRQEDLTPKTDALVVTTQSSDPCPLMNALSTEAPVVTIEASAAALALWYYHTLGISDAVCLKAPNGLMSQTQAHKNSGEIPNFIQDITKKPEQSSSSASKRDSNSVGVKHSVHNAELYNKNRDKRDQSCAAQTFFMPTESFVEHSSQLGQDFTTVTGMVPNILKKSKESSDFIPNTLFANPILPKNPEEKETALIQLLKKIKEFKDLKISQTAEHTVFSDGNPHSAIMLVGEAPGAEEDRQGKPFVGASGKLLNAMLASIGLDRSNVYITNVVPWRPPFNRQPSTEEIAACLPFLQQHIAIIQPRILVCVGGVATKTLLNLKETLTQSQGRAWSYASNVSPEIIPTWTLYHPAYLMRSPGQKKVAWQQLQCIQAFLDDMGLIYRAKNKDIKPVHKIDVTSSLPDKN